jgi:hypothetical protein
MQPDDEAPDTAAPADDRYYYPEGGYYFKLVIDQE